MVHGISPPVLIIGRENRAAGSNKKRGFLQKVSVDCDLNAARLGTFGFQLCYLIDGYGVRAPACQRHTGHKRVRGRVRNRGT